MSEERNLPARHCPQCELPLLDTDSRCPFCGKRVGLPPQTVGRRVAKVISLIGLIIVGLPAALLGACGLLVGMSGSTASLPAVAFGVAAFAVFGLILWGFIAAWRK